MRIRSPNPADRECIHDPPCDLCGDCDIPACICGCFDDDDKPDKTGDHE